MNRKSINSIVGKKFSRLTVVKKTTGKRPYRSYYKCKCRCGNFCVVDKSNLITGNTSSCGCIKKEALMKRNVTHGKCGTRIHRIWSRMIQRCHNKNSSDYSYYGGKGVAVCKRWRESFENFYADVGDPPTKLHTLDRKEVSKPYKLSNIRWATRREQANNRTNNVMLTYKRRTQSLPDWARELNLSEGMISQRIKKLRWSVSKALTTSKIGNR